MDVNLMRKIRLPEANPREELELLRKAVDMFFQLDIKSLKYEELYQAGYKLVTSKHGRQLYNELGEWLSFNMKILTTKIRPIEEPIVFLNSIKELWCIAKTAIYFTSQTLIYLENRYLKENKLIGIRTLGYKYFSDVLLKNSGNGKRITNAVLSEVKKERDGEFIKRAIIKAVSEILFTITESAIERVYYDYIEDPYIAKLKEYLEVSCEKLISELTVANYLLEAEKIIEREVERGKELLIPISQEKVFTCLRAILIENNINAFLVNDYSWLEELIQQNRLEDLSRAYRLLCNKRNPQISGRFAKTLDVILTKIGEKSIQQPIAEHSWLKLIDNLIAIIDKYESMLLNQFSKDAELNAIVKKILVHLVNFDDTIYKALASYYNYILNKNAPQISNPEQEQRAEGLMTIFKKVRSKDSFAMWYIRLMAKRLLGKTSKSDDAERSILKGFKAECGIQYTLKMESMMKDIVLSQNECKEFLDMYEDLPCQFDAFVLTNGLWSFSNVTISSVLPSQLQIIRKRFENFYFEKHKGRKLMWKMDKSTIELLSSFTSTNQRYFFTSYMMEGMILLLFNEYEKINVELIWNILKIPNEVIKDSMAILTKMKILIQDNNNYVLNVHFKSKTMRVRIASSDREISKVENDKETETTLRREREQRIDATLVKIMKARHHVSHNTLIEDAIKILTAFFPPDPLLIKLRIEHLIEAEYIIRAQNDRTAYIYNA